MNKIIDDKELGILVVKENPRATQFIFRAKSDGIYVTVPKRYSEKELQNAIESQRSKLLEIREKKSRKPVDLSYKIDSDFFKLSLITGTGNRFISRSKPGEMIIICPAGTDFNDDALQGWLRKVIAEALKRTARIFLSERLSKLSAVHELPFKQLKINSSKGRWGSCSAEKNINLSCFSVLLPSHLIDYVLLHELAHTIEMNHSSKFWDLLNKLTDGNAIMLRKELKEYGTIFN